MTASLWWRDFRFHGATVEVRKTGARVPLDAAVLQETAAWLAFHFRVEAERLGVPRRGPRLWFAPDRPRPWYLIWPVVQMAGLRIARRPQDANLGFCFEDLTTVDRPAAPPGLRLINAGCLDTSKSRVASVFEAVSGRALAVDPAIHDGPYVDKSEANGAHDGVVRTAPTPAAPGRAYQRLIDTVAADGCVEDLRCPTVGGEIPVVFLKRRPVADRFANHNCDVQLLDPDAVFSAAERRLIKQFCAAFGLDWGGLDVLRDRMTGELWIVDVNKTDMGPPIALPLADKMTAVRRLAAHLRAFVDTAVTGA